MKPQDILPLNYWLRTRIKTSKTLLIYLVMNLLIAASIIVYAKGFGVTAFVSIVHLTIFWLAYLSLYELGYFHNDFWSLKKEQESGINLEKQAPELFDKKLLYLAVVSRLIFSLSLFYLLDFLLAPAILHELFIILLIIFLAFAAHNTIAYKLRPFSFFLLYFGRYALVYPFVKHEFNSLVLFYIFIIPALGYTLIYTLSKNIALSNLSKLLPSDNILLVLRLTLFAYIIAIPISLLLQLEGGYILLTLSACYLAIDLTFAISRFISALKQSFSHQNERFHIHTKFSHDCDVEPADICLKALSCQVKKLYITDHFETFDRWKFQALKESLNEAMHRHDCEMVAGLEYDVQGQHFLAIQLKQYVGINSEEISSLPVIKANCSTLIWAHPHFAIKQLTSKTYLADMLKMMYFCDGIEWLNVKSSRGSSYHWRHALISFLAIGIFGNKKLIIGLDAHTLKDWDNFSPAIEKSFLAFLLPKSANQAARVQTS